MTAAEFEQNAKRHFQAAGLLPDLDSDRSRVLEFPDGLFVEIVVRDQTRLQDFQNVVDELASKTDERVDAIVRAEWRVERVGDPQPAYAADGGLRFAELYPIELESGAAHQQVWVEVTVMAKLFFRDHSIDGDEIRNIVREFVNEQLEIGGASYWDPVRSPNLEINADTARQIISRSLLKKRAV
jgi:hypothetical protein